MKCTTTMIIAVALATTVVAQSRRIFVDGTVGDDSNPGTLSNPKRSITAAIQNLSSNTDVVIAGGVYAPSTTGETFPLRVDAANVKVRGTPDRTFGGTVIDLEGGSSGAIQFGVNAAGGRMSWISIQNAGHNPGSAVVDAGAAGVTIEYSTIDGGGVGMRAGHGSTVHHNVCDGPIVGVEVTASSTIPSATEVYQNTIVNCPGSGLTAAGSVFVSSNILSGCGEGLRGVGTLDPNDFTHNDFYSNGVDQAGSLAGATLPGSLFVDPQLQPDYWPLSFLVGTGGDPSLPCRAAKNGYPWFLQQPPCGAHGLGPGFLDLARRSDGMDVFYDSVPGPSALLLGWRRSCLGPLAPLNEQTLLLDPASIFAALPGDTSQGPIVLNLTFPVPPPRGTQLSCQATGLYPLTGSSELILNQVGTIRW